MSLRQDIWLSDVLGFPVYATGPEGDSPQGPERSLTYVKLDVSDIVTLASLTSQGFMVVEVNITFSRHATALGKGPSEVAVRPARPKDAAALVAIASRCFRYSRFHVDPWIPDELANRVKREWVTSYLEERRGIELLAAVEADEPVGFLAVIEDAGTRVIDLVGVAPEAQGRGVGHALVTAFINRHAPKASELRVGTQLANVPSLRLYEGLGFRVSSAAYTLHLHRDF